MTSASFATRPHLPGPRRFFTLCFIFTLLLTTLQPGHAAQKDWEDILAKSRGKTVNWYMWGGSPAVNGYVNGFVKNELESRYGIILRQVPVKDIAEVVSKLLVEKQAGKTEDGSVDLMWINGENFRTAKKHQLLYGPFADLLPNMAYVDTTSPTVANDFGTPVEGMESPWGSAQMVMIYDQKRIPSPPRTMAELIAWIKANPGRFTYPAPPDFTGSVMVRHFFYHLSDARTWQQQYSQEQLTKAGQETFNLLNELVPYLWREGATYPDSPVRMNTLFADGEIDFSFSYHQGEASRNIADGIFKDSVRSFVFTGGTIANTHFLAIPFNSAQKEAAMVVADFLLSPEAQLEKAKPDVWGDFPVLQGSLLAEDWQEKFTSLPRGIATLDDHELQAHQLPEPPSEILIYLEKGWQQQVLKRQ